MFFLYGCGTVSGTQKGTLIYKTTHTASIESLRSTFGLALRCTVRIKVQACWGCEVLGVVCPTLNLQPKIPETPNLKRQTIHSDPFNAVHTHEFGAFRTLIVQGFLQVLLSGFLEGFYTGSVSVFGFYKGTIRFLF